MNLVKKLALAITATATFATSAGVVASGIDVKNDVINNLSNDCDKKINLVHYVKAEHINDKYFVTFDAHFDTGLLVGITHLLLTIII